jgi:hypothetical protein
VATQTNGFPRYLGRYKPLPLTNPVDNVADRDIRSVVPADLVDFIKTHTPFKPPRLQIIGFRLSPLGLAVFGRIDR